MKSKNLRFKRYKADFLLLVVVAVWGSTFPVMKIVLLNIDSFYFIALRFFVAFFSLVLIFKDYIKKVTKSSIYKGLIPGLWLLSGYSFQIIGLQYTTASRSAFITGLSVVIVPLIAIFILKTIPDLMNYLGVIVAVIGLLFMTGIRAEGVHTGDYLTFLAALSFAMQIVFVSKYLLSGENSVVLTLIQMGIVAAGSAIIFLFTNSSYQINFPVFVVILYTGLFATAFAYLVQSYAQRFTSATHTALVFTMEPVSGAIFSYIVLGELMSSVSIMGGILIIIGMLISELKFFRKKS